MIPSEALSAIAVVISFIALGRQIWRERRDDKEKVRVELTRIVIPRRDDLLDFYVEVRAYNASKFPINVVKAQVEMTMKTGELWKQLLPSTSGTIPGVVEPRARGFSRMEMDRARMSGVLWAKPSRGVITLASGAEFVTAWVLLEPGGPIDQAHR